MDGKNLLLIGIGGASGAACRYLVGQALTTQFPYETMIVNIVGCLLLGLFSTIFNVVGTNHYIKNGVTIGFCGSFTTMSTFAADVYILEYNMLPLYIVGSVGIGLAASYLGELLAKMLLRKGGFST
ncbi:CrcB family protein [Bacillus timonensis]|nr:CrcB family protein [Bacillus timonensis]